VTVRLVRHPVLSRRITALTRASGGSGPVVCEVIPAVAADDLAHHYTSGSSIRYTG